MGRIHPMHRAEPSYEYPRVYRTTGFWRYGFPVAGIALFALAGLWIWDISHETQKTLLFILSFLAVLGGVYMIAYPQRAQLTLRQDEIELSGIVITQVMSHDQILGYRRASSKDGPPFIILYPKSSGGRKMRIPDMFGLDDAFERWLNGIPNLD